MKSDTIKIKENSTIQNIIISEIRDFINLKNLEPGDKLPSQRVLSEKFNVSRNLIKEVIDKLEFYELLKTIPQAGTFVANIGQIALNGIIEGIMTLEKQDFKSLVETRLMLEAKTVFLAAERRTEEDLINLENALNAYCLKHLSKEVALEEDLLFHLAIAKASGNNTLNALMLQITPKIITEFEKTRVCHEDDFIKEVKNHEAIFQAIKDQDTKIAQRAMEVHFERLVKFSEKY